MSGDIGILIIRVLFGMAIAAHGAQKVFGWFSGYGLKGTGGFFEQLGFRPGVPFAAAAGLRTWRRHSADARLLYTIRLRRRSGGDACRHRQCEFEERILR